MFWFMHFLFLDSVEDLSIRLKASRKEVESLQQSLQSITASNNHLNIINNHQTEDIKMLTKKNEEYRYAH